jgi:hypothetical protein
MLSVSDLRSQQKPVHKPAVHAIIVPKPTPSQAWIGVFAGPNLNYLDYYDRVTTIEGKNTSFHAGFFYQKKIGKYFALQPALIFSIRGGRIRNVDSTINARLMNIELPVNFLYLYKHMVIGAGPNFTYGIKGNLKSDEVERNAYNADESLERTLKRFEAGGNFLIGYTFKKGIFISANFSPGFTNIYKGDSSAPRNVRAGTRVFGISLGYLFDVTNDSY